MKWLIAICFLFPSLAWANSLVIGFGPSLDGGTYPKYAELGFEFIQPETSELLECVPLFESPLNAACSVVVSARVETLSGLFVAVGVGPTWVFNKDDRISSHFNFSPQAAVGFVNNSGLVIAGKIVHFSNAGLWPPNLGREFIGAMIEVPL